MIRSIRNLRRLLLGTVTFAVPVTVSFIDLVGCVVKVEGVSMQPALNPLGDGRSAVDYVFLNRWAANAYHFQRGEIVSLRSPSNPDQNLIKRIIALEGDLVKTLAYKEAVVHVPSGHCWVEGDHHKNSMDSNFFGPVSLGLISAKASHIVWPPSRWQRLTIQASEDHRVNCLDTFLES